MQQLNDEEIALLAGMVETPVGRAMLHKEALEVERLAKKAEDPRLNTEHVTDDFRYVMGEQRGVGFLRRAMEESRRKLGITSGEDT